MPWNHLPAEESFFSGNFEVDLKGLHLDDCDLASAASSLLYHSSNPAVAPPLQRLLLLNLSQNSLTDAACKILQDIVSRSNSLRMLDLRHNSFTAEGRHFLVEAIGRNISVVEVSHKMEFQMIEGIRSSESGPLRIDCRYCQPPLYATTLEDKPCNRGSIDDVEIKRLTELDSSIIMSKQKSKPRSARRRSIHSAQKIASALGQADNCCRSSSSEAQFEVIDGGCPLDYKTEASKITSEDNLEHVKNLKLIADIDGGAMEELTSNTKIIGTSSSPHISSTLDSPLNCVADVLRSSRKPRPLSAPSLSQRTKLVTKRIYGASPFPLPAKTAEFITTSKSSGTNAKQHKMNTKSNDKNIVLEVSPDLSGSISLTPSQHLPEELEMFNPFKIF